MPATEPLFTTPGIERIFSAEQRVQRMLDFEAALVGAQASIGLVPDAASELIVACCQAKLFNPDSILEAARSAGNPAIPLVKALTDAVAARDPDAGHWVHWGATSQDAIDSAIILQLRDACELIIGRLSAAESRIAELAGEHLRTPMVARTLLQQASATTLGCKLAVWGHGIERARMGLQGLKHDAFALQLGGAVGTFSLMGSDGPAIQRAVAAQLSLAVPAMSWHTQRDRMTTIGAAFATTVVACAKLANDLMLMMQSEVGEAVEDAHSAGGSSAMPNKRNPVRALVPAAAAANVGGLLAGLFGNALHEHERAAGAWHGEWFALPQLAAMADASACAVADLVGTMAFSPERMRANLDSGGGLVAAEALTAALAKWTGKAAARPLVERLCAEVRLHGGTLAERAASAPGISLHLDDAQLAAIFSHATAIDAAARTAQSWLEQRQP